MNLSFISLEHIPRSVAGSGGYSMWTSLFALRKAEQLGGRGILQAKRLRQLTQHLWSLGWGKGSDNTSKGEPVARLTLNHSLTFKEL